MGEAWQGLTLQGENPGKGKVDMQGIHSSAVFLEGRCQHGQEGRASPGCCDGNRIPSSDVAIEVLPKPFPAPVCQTPFEAAEAAFL